jgi:hypothetical protein
MAKKVSTAQKKSKDDPSQNFYDDIKQIIADAQHNAVRSVEFHRVVMYWKLGERVFIEEQRGQDRAEYGQYLLKNLASVIEPKYGSGFGLRQLERARRFYRTYPIATALRTQLNWFQYRLLISINDDRKREYYELEASNHAWTGCELERQINFALYERLLVSNDKEAVLAIARKERIPEKPTEIIKRPPRPLTLPQLAGAFITRIVQWAANTKETIESPFLSHF